MGVPAAFLVGVSGVGKSVVAGRLQAAHGWLLLDVDEAGGPGNLGLRREWRRLDRKGDAAPLAAAVQERAAGRGAAGAVVSMPSTYVLAIDKVRAAQAVGLRTVVLWGDWEACKAARIERDLHEGKRFSERTYARLNKGAFRTYGGSGFAGLRLDAFRADGARAPVEDLVAEILRRLA